MKLRLRIESLVHGGDALARIAGRVVFVPGGVPGDLVEAELAGEAGDLRDARFLRARMVRVVEPGPSRVEAPCPIVDRCGGCPIQHVSTGSQREAKAALVEDALVRIGGFPAGSVEIAPLVASPLELRYRRRARLHRGPGGAYGFAGHATNEVVPVAECLLFEPALQTLADEVRAAAADLGGLPDVTDLAVDVSDAGAGSLDLRTEKPPTPALRKRAQALLDAVRTLRGVTVGPAGAPEVIGDPVIADAASPARFRTRADLFAQANRAAAPLLIRTALDALGSAAEGKLLELFCGSGTFTLPLLGRAAEVVGVEASAPSLTLLRRSAVEAGLDRRARLQLVAGDAAKVAQGLAKTERGKFDAVLLDPPRTGAANVLRALEGLDPTRIVYVSCDAPTFARDAKVLAAAGYRLERVVPFDLFPQTAHLELVGLLIKQ